MSHLGQEYRDRLIQAFPHHLAADATVAIGRLPSSEHQLSPDDISVKECGESLLIPSRTYHSETLDLFTLTNVQQQIVNCIFTRNCDGFLREKHLRILLEAPLLPWHCPFIILLLGEYVVEIQQLIVNHPSLKSTVCSDFIAENPALIATLKKRIVSYWNDYYRRQYPDIKQYPGYLAGEDLNLWNKYDLPNLAR